MFVDIALEADASGLGADPVRGDLAASAFSSTLDPILVAGAVIAGGSTFLLVSPVASLAKATMPVSLPFIPFTPLSATQLYLALAFGAGAANTGTGGATLALPLPLDPFPFTPTAPSIFAFGRNAEDPPLQLVFMLVDFRVAVALVPFSAFPSSSSSSSSSSEPLFVRHGKAFGAVCYTGVKSYVNT